MALPRPRTPSAQQRASALATAATARPSGKGVREARQKIAALAWDARLSGDWATYREVMRRLAELRARTKDDKWRPTPAFKPTRTHWRESSVSQRTREAEQRADSDASPRRAQVQAERDRQYAERWGANAVAQAVWAVHQGERDWEAIPTRPTTLPAYAPSGESSSSVSGPARLTIRVPARQDQPERRFYLFRSDYDQLLELWGYARVAQAHTLATSLRISGSRAEVDALYTLALGSARHPNLARSWHAFVTSPRFGDLFREHVSGTVQLNPNRNGDLREAALEVFRQCQEVAYQNQTP